MAITCDYEKQRESYIQKNKALLKELGLDKPKFERKEKPRRKSKSVPRKRVFESEEDDESKPAQKTQRTSVESDVAATGIRRSARNAGKCVDYKSEHHKGTPEPLMRNHKSGNEGQMGSEGGKRTQDPKVFGHIPGIEVGTWWEMREGCSTDAVHAPWVAGISGGPKGAYSVALSGGYEDDVDLGYGFTYTGSGGRDLRGTKNAPKNLRTGPQSSDQSFDHPFNNALLKSVETKKPVRVIRGFKLNSKYAPSEGYRYDGLYTVEKAWTEKGLNPKGYLVCKFAFKRLLGQPPIPIRGDDAEDGQEDEEDEDNQDES
ncbi:hypothetical protein M378DRAFT_155736 [Amanita muscaria Koide BX008]|uniref:YDG domain-containing protein n=1 Tax=Amanita muscaria (strain Koide BX008) TaxID=946122 RepID=A0A0C2T4H0_AMAMK|nr:hypothetical protein M378DRAFT_155736 [Amanita muscaria Koide BX008]